MTKIAFCRYFKQATHLTFTEFLNRYRIKQAQRLLLLNKKVSEVCYDCGFESVSYFNRVFKEITFLTPLEYKRSNGYA
jgi:AraC-like DNA-binding protein